MEVAEHGVVSSAKLDLEVEYGLLKFRDLTVK